MKVVYTYTEGMEPIYIDKSNGTQRVLIVFKDSDKTFVYYCDDSTSQVFLNEIISTTMLGFTLDNFKRIDDDDQFDRYLTYIKNNYNYSGEHLSEKITGHDIGNLVPGHEGSGD